MKKTYQLCILFLTFICLTFSCRLCALATQQDTTNEAESDATTSNETDWEFSFIKKKESLKVNKKCTFKTNAPEQGQVTYKVSNKKYASITTNGVLRGKRAGTVTVSATYNDQTIQCKVKIKGKKIIYIDPGHQQYADLSTEPIGPGSSTRKEKMTGGATGVATGIPEYKFTLTISKKLKTALEKKGYEVVLSRTKHNVKMGNVARAKKGNKAKANICIRIHADSFSSSSARGASVLYASSSNPYYARKYAKKSKKLATKLIDEYCDATGIYKRGIVVRNDLTGTNWSKMPTVLIECGFMSNPTEDRKLNNAAFQKKMVKGMVNGIDAYFGY
ncbi:MAG: hypothetical protein E7264_05680 [Lachnospiraceae bacterium]|nr:hypothetical protein [Lachnospiraceae bacterium]